MKNERNDMKEVVDCADHSLGVLSGLARLRKAGVLLDTQLLAEGLSFQVSRIFAAYFLWRIQENATALFSRNILQPTRLPKLPSCYIEGKLRAEATVGWLRFMRI